MLLQLANLKPTEALRQAIKRSPISLIKWLYILRPLKGTNPKLMTTPTKTFYK